MLFPGILLALILVLVAACGVMLYRVYAWREASLPAGDAAPAAGTPQAFAAALTELLNERLHDLSDPAIRFALQSRIDAAILMADSVRSLSLLEVFFDLERFENPMLGTEEIARLGGANHPVARLLQKAPAVREALLVSDLAEQLRRDLTAVVGTRRTAIDFQNAGPLPEGDADCVRWYADGNAQQWFARITEQARHGIGSSNMAAMIETAARKLGHTIPLACFPNVLAIAPSDCLTPEKTYAASRSVLWNDFLETRRSLETSQNALRQLNDQLEERVRVRTAELEAAKLRAEASERAKDRFLANMSHELRTPLNAIIGFSEVLTDRLFGDLNERQAKYIDNVLVSGRHLLRLINDILDLSKVEAGRVSLELSPFDPADALRDVHTIVKTLANTKGIRLSFEMAPGMPHVTADLQKFKQIMYNLLSNAIKFTRPGGTVNTVAAVTAESGTGAPLLQVSVQDTGIGIKAADHERIFKEFEQVDSSYGREQQGTGLGLALTKQLIRLHGGHIWLKSEEGKGSTFTFVIPVAAEDAADDAAAARHDTPAAVAVVQTGRPTVLVAEDDPHASELLEQYIAGAGYHVQHAFDGEQAVALARQIHPSAITLDIMLPKKDGWTVLAELKSGADTKSIPVVIVSITDDRQLGFSLGATDFLLKPVKKEQLSDVLDRAVAASKRIRTMLVVDDEPTTVEFVGDLLSAHGVQTLKAYGGREGVEMAIQHHPDAIILDLMMPEVTGFDVVRRLREDPGAREIPIVILTAKDLTHDERQELNRNVQAIASKAGGEELLRELARLERVWQ